MSNISLYGGALLHRVPWPRGSTYESVSHLYVSNVTHTVLPSLPSMDIIMTRQPKMPTSAKNGKLCRVDSACRMIIKSKKDVFLNSKVNKQRSIQYLIQCQYREGTE